MKIRFKGGIKINNQLDEMKDFIIIDPSLKSFNGHFLTYDTAIATEAKKFGYKTVVLASNEAIDMETKFKVFPSFKLGLEHDFIKVPILKKINFFQKINKYLIERQFVSDLISANITTWCKKNPIIFFHTTTSTQIPPLIRWVKKNIKLNPIIFIMLRYAPSPNPYYPFSGEFLLYSQALEYLENSGISKYFRLIVDSELLKEEYELITNIPIYLVPIPHTLDQKRFEYDKTIDNKKLLTYLGNARATKGFQYLPYLLQNIQDRLNSGEWGAEFQANVMFARDQESIVSLSLMRKMPVILHEYELSMIEYENLLKRSSLVLIPYQLLYYYSQTSGVLCEALGAGKPVVVPSGTWMARQIKEKNIGVTFYPGDRRSFFEETVKAMNNIEYFTEQAIKFRSEWISYHNSTNFIKTLLELL